MVIQGNAILIQNVQFGPKSLYFGKA